ncbi:hypothetical protein MMC10_003605 [Thelotrema lepadinum]|nr:hypothetical protein [Thelotrema lepadinum]
MASSNWALDQLSRLLPLDEDSLKQILDYSSSLSEYEAADHLKNLLGDTPQALEFISSYNSRRKPTNPAPQGSSESQATQNVPKTPRTARKKKTPLNNLPPPRRPEDYGNVSGGYQKKRNEDEFLSNDPRQHHQRKEKAVSNPFTLSEVPAAQQAPRATLDPFLLNVSTRTASPSKSGQSSQAHTPSKTLSRTASPRPTSSSSSPAPKQKVSITGGTPMHGASSTLADLDSALRSLEMSTNPTLYSSEADSKARACSCMGSLHPLLSAAPNCLSCGKIICAKEGLAPCTFCGSPLLSSLQIQEMVHELREERGRERMAANNAAQGQRGGKGPAPGAPPLASTLAGITGGDADLALAQATAHRDRLLEFQSSNAKRTTVMDEAAAFETPDKGVSQWGTAKDRAQEFKAQQRALRELEWNAKPEWEKRKVVTSISLVGGKAIKSIQKAERPEESDAEGLSGEEENLEAAKMNGKDGGGERGGGAFAKNPLLGKLVKPVWRNLEHEDVVAESSEIGKGERRREGKNLWRRVQDDADDNERIILNGGILGGRESERIFAEEPACG